MAVWAYACTSCAPDSDDVWYASSMDVHELDESCQIVKIQIGKQWRCAKLDRSARVEVEQMLIRTVMGTSAQTCEECKDE